MMSLTLYLCRKNTFPGQMRCIFFSVSPRDREFPKTGHKMLAKWGIRLPNQFLSHNTLLQSKNQAKVAYFTKLMILIFGCPEEIRITNFTRMPLVHCNVVSTLCEVSETLTEWKSETDGRTNLRTDWPGPWSSSPPTTSQSWLVQWDAESNLIELQGEMTDYWENY